jgi:hypothetical protein
VHVLDARAGWSLPQRDLEACHRLGLAAGHHLDAAVVKILHRSGNALAASRVECEVTKSDALDAAGQKESFSDQHEPLIIVGLA